MKKTGDKMHKKKKYWMKNKKSLAANQVLIFLVIGAFVFLVLANIVPKLLGKSAAETSDFLDSGGDYDNDGVANYFDKCKCVPGDTGNGCEFGTDVDDPDHDPYDQCPEEMIPSHAKK